MATLAQHRLFEKVLEGMDLTLKEELELFSERISFEEILSLEFQRNTENALEMLHGFVSDVLREPKSWHAGITVSDKKQRDKFAKLLIETLQDEEYLKNE